MPSNTSVNRYGSIAAEIYDIDKPLGSMPDTAFHLDTLRDVEGPILEPACGTGRTLLPLLQAGHEAAGFDTSDDMLDRCQARCCAAGFAPDLTRQSFADFAYDRRFAAIVVPAGSFTLIGDFAEAMAILARFHDHMSPGGLLVLDIQPLSYLAHTSEDRRSWTAENGDLLTCEGKLTAVDWLEQRAMRGYRYERWREGRLIDSQLETMVQRYWGREEFALALKSASFEVTEISGDWRRGQPLRPNARTLTFVARRAQRP